MSMKWHSKTLDELCYFKNGLWKGKKEPFIHVGVIRNTNFTKNGQLDDSDIAYLDVESKQYSSRKLEYGDLILEKSGGGPKQPVGRVIPFEKKEGEFSFSNFTSIIRILNKEELDFLYLHRYLHFLYVSGATEPMQKHSTGIRNLQLKEYKEIEIPLAPIAEQKRIVAILDEAFAGIDTAIANTEKNLANARELFDSSLNSLLIKRGENWENIKLDDACVVERGSSPRPIKAFLTDKDDGVNWVKIGDTKGITKYIKTTKQKITQEGALRSRRVEPGDFILTNSMSYGRPYIMATTGYIHDGWFVLRLKESINTDYFYHLLSSRIVQDQFGVLAAGAVVKNISSGLVKQAILPIPPMEQQLEIVKSVESLSDQVLELESIYKEKLSALNELKQSLLQKAFSGELTAENGEFKEEAVA